MAKSNDSQRRRLRSQLWFDNPDNPGMTALYLERYLNYGLTRAELTSGKPIIGIPLYTSNASLNVQEIKAGLNFRFGGP
jgi:dihydroxy-acid dehydratase